MLLLSNQSDRQDRKLPEWFPGSKNQGDDIAGIVHSVGENVTEFKPGDRVAAFHEMQAPGGSYAEYALAWQHTTFHLPKKTSFEGTDILPGCPGALCKDDASRCNDHANQRESEAAALPLAGMTAALGLYLRLCLPAPWTPATDPLPLIIYGGATAVGAYAIQMARHSNIHPLITVAGRGAQHVESLIDRSKGDTVVDYRSGDDAVVQGMKDALKGQKVYHAFDAVSEKGSSRNICKVLEQGGKITRVLPTDAEGIPDTVQSSMTMVGSVHKEAKEFGFVWFRLMARGLADGWFSAHPTEVVRGGLGGIQTALENLKAGKASAVKYIFRIEDTEGAGQDEA